MRKGDSQNHKREDRQKSRLSVSEEHYMTTQPILDDSGDKVISCGVLAISKDHEDTQLLNRLRSNTKIGLILSVRAFGMYGLDI